MVVYYNLGPASTKAAPSSLSVYCTKFLIKRLAKSVAFVSHSDVLAFFSPTGIKSLFKNFPNFEQNNTRIAVFGPTTQKEALDHGLRVDILAPAPGTPSMTGALEKYVAEANKGK